MELIILVDLDIVFVGMEVEFGGDSKFVCNLDMGDILFEEVVGGELRGAVSGKGLSGSQILTGVEGSEVADICELRGWDGDSRREFQLFDSGGSLAGTRGG